MIPIYRASFLILFLNLFISYAANGTHLRAGEIIAVRENCTELTFRITITVYIDTQTGVRFGGPGELLKFGDGAQIEVPETPTLIRKDLGNEMGIATYSILHTYAGPGRYLITYEEANRNRNILNIGNSVGTHFFLLTSINIDPFLGCSNTPQLRVPPIDKACTGSAWLHNPGAFDPDGDSLSFELTIPKQEGGRDVDNYRNPNVREFYDRIGLDYAKANENKTGEPTFAIDPYNGTITWDAPGVAGEYNIAFIIKEWRKINGVWISMGFVTRDMQIIVEDCKNERPRIEQPVDICVEAGEEILMEIIAFDPDKDDIKIEAYSEVLSLLSSPAIVLPDPAIFQSSPGKITFKWKTVCEHIRNQPYKVVFKVKDNPNPGTPLVDFKTWNIKIVAPAPVWVSANTDLNNRSIHLNWQRYSCSNATSIQVWRRVDAFHFTPPRCVTGIPDFLGYSKIAEVPASSTSYTDTNGNKGLAVGAAYCYRLLAIFPGPNGAESYVSAELCIPPIKADAPVITNVSVEKTDLANGSIGVKWLSPFDIDKTQFPEPYTYEVYRAETFDEERDLKKAHPGRIANTAFVDSGINTEQLVYNYRIVAYDANGTKIDTSKTASSVRLQAKPDDKFISLTWAATVPWFNLTQEFSTHLIYRGQGDATDDQLVLIDKVDVIANGLHYTDRGNYLNEPLKENERYCYRIMTNGAYGNPKIEEPLTNFSQTVCTSIGAKPLPCKPILEMVGIDCDAFESTTLCGAKVFSNTIRWFRSKDVICKRNIRGYTIYTADRAGGNYSLLANNVLDTFYVHANLPSFAQCYRVTSIDLNGVESEMSDEFCFDNCPRYELPNVFTPDGDNCNDYFSAWGSVENKACGEQDKMKCARFVSKVEFIVYNRWGREVYQYNSGKEKSIYINWNGRDNRGHELSGGVYYYKAIVYYITSRPENESHEIKGWVHLIHSN